MESVCCNTQAEDLILYHASAEIVTNPSWNYWPDGKITDKRDFGMGFYMCIDREYPLRLYSKNNDEIFLNKYKLDLANLDVLIFDDDVRWLLTVACHRSSLKKNRKYKNVYDSIRENISKYDLIIGTISNDRFYSTATFFIRGIFTDYMAINIAQMMKFGTQYVLKSDKACSQIHHLGAEKIGVDEIMSYRIKVTSDEEVMAELVERKRAELHSTDRGKFIHQLLGGLEDVDISGWLRDR